MSKPIIDQDMYILVLKAQLMVTTAEQELYRTAANLETLLEDIDNKLSEYDTTEDAEL